jgi:histidinol-phosphate/aromatic aminotransferase/cobyric acid decarboxylase-like protein
MRPILILQIFQDSFNVKSVFKPGNFANAIKSLGACGLRVGMCFASPEIIAILNKIKPPYNISILSQTAAEEGLDNESAKNEWVIKLLQKEKIRTGTSKDKNCKEALPF